MRSIRIPKSFFLSLFLMILLLAVQAEAGQATIFKLKVIVQAANIRSKPDISSPILKTVPAGTLFESPGKEGRWYKLSLPPDAKGNVVFGYIYDSLVEIVEEIKAEPPKIEAPTPPKKEEAAVDKAVPVEKPEPQSAAPRPVHRKRNFSLRPYSKIGSLLTPPSASDLGYISADGGSVDEYLDLSAFNFGGGVQFLLSLNPENTLSVGLDLGAQKLFSSVFTLETSDIVYEDVHHDREFSFYLLALLELRSRQSPLFFQAGAGMHLVSWYWDYTYSGKYSNVYEEESGSGINMALLLAGGFDIPVSERISVPVMLRMDGLLRYGILLNVSLNIGLSFH